MHLTRKARVFFGVLVAPTLMIVPVFGSSSVARSAVDWIVARQAANGAYFLPTQRADYTAETLASLASVGVPRSSERKALDAIRKGGPHAASRPAYAGRIVMGLVSVGENPRAFDGVDYVARISAGFNAATGAYETGLYADALALLGLVAANEPIPAQALAYVRVNQCANGGFGHDPGCPAADVDTTALVLDAIVGAGVSSSDSLRSGAVSWLRSMKQADGTFAAEAGGPPNANSTGLAICALATAGVPVGNAGIFRFVDPSGGFRYLATDDAPNDYATEQALPAVVNASYPLRGSVYDAPAASPTSSSPSSTGAVASSPSLPASSAASARASSVVQPGTGASPNVNALSSFRSSRAGAHGSSMRWLVYVALFLACALAAALATLPRRGLLARGLLARGLLARGLLARGVKALRR